ncbi:MAG: DUF3422 domain-containing protein [Gammaproteobacteria bacterium]|jgi:uncharacterized membrane-anchored protein
MTLDRDPAIISQLKPHPLREEIYGELHARPTPLLDVPLRASHLVFLTDLEEMAASHAHVVRLAKRYSTTAPTPDSNYFHGHFGGFDLRWEKHTEFCSLTVLRSGVGEQPFEDTAFNLLPEDWVDAIPGQLVVAAHLSVLPQQSAEPDGRQLEEWFEGQLVIGSRLSDGRVSAWTTFRMHRDGFSRFLVRDNGLSPYQAGRTVQRLLELETYRVMSLLALQEARKLAPETTRLDEELAAVMDRFISIESADDERQLLSELSGLAATVEHHRSTTNYRFGATRAYYSLVQGILANLREEHYPGMSSMAKFLDRRLGPGVRTCFAMEDRLENLSQRVGRAGELLQARINVNIETQNQSLLAAMNRRSGLQLRLQQTVEGLSVAAISYYTVALLHILFEALESTGVPVRSDIATGISVPVVILVVWSLVRRIRRHLGRADEDPAR